MTTTDLLPCPFCGGTNIEIGILQSHGNGTFDWKARCDDCDVCYDTEVEAIAAWNRRTAPATMATPINHIELMNLGFLDAGIDGLYYLPVSEARIQVMLYADGRTEVEIAESGNCDTVSMPGATKTGHLLDLIAMLEEANS